MASQDEIMEAEAVPHAIKGRWMGYDGGMLEA